ncbi:MAG: DNA cytosine methyltransferase [Acidimicrobiales bacterium]
MSLFCGAGGLDRGFKDAGFPLALAIDSSAAAIETHKRNFPRTDSTTADLIKLGPAGVLERLGGRVDPGSAIGVIGGPPCQGFSRANTAARSDDPRNELPSLYLRIIDELRSSYDVEFVVFENVLGIKDRKHLDTFATIVDGLRDMNFTVTERELCALDFAVPQSRRRIVLIGMRSGRGYGPIKIRKRSGKRTVREAIEGLPEPVLFRRDLTADDFDVHPNHWTMQPRSFRFVSGEADDFDGRSFKRLDWDKPSPTIAFGHREILVHPSGKRRLSILEAMRLQGFPDEYVLEGNLSEQVEQVSNAVPPPLARSVANAVNHSLNTREGSARRRAAGSY